MKKQKDWRDRYPKTGPLRKENLDQIQFRNFKWLDKLSFILLRSGKIRIQLIFNAKHRDSGRKTPVFAYADYDRKLFKNNRILLRKVQEIAIHGVTHEVNECLVFKKKRVFDPHKGEK
jgi:hypothetical protein